MLEAQPMENQPVQKILVKFEKELRQERPLSCSKTYFWDNNIEKSELFDGTIEESCSLGMAPTCLVRDKNTFPYNCHGVLVCKFPHEEYFYGTAFQISQRDILTCAHNFYHRKYKHKAIQAYYFPATTGLIDLSFSSGIKVETFSYPEEFETCDCDDKLLFDYGHASLQKPNSLSRYLDLNPQKALKDGEHAIICGFPAKGHRSIDQNRKACAMYEGKGEIRVDKVGIVNYKIQTEKGASGSSISTSGSVFAIHSTGSFCHNSGRILTPEVIARIQVWMQKAKKIITEEQTEKNRQKLKLSSEASILKNLAQSNKMSKNYGKSIEMYQACLVLINEEVGTQHPQYADLLHEIALVLIEMRRDMEANYYAKQVLSIYEKEFGTKHPIYRKQLQILGQAFAKIGSAWGENYCRKSLWVTQIAVGKDSKEYAMGLKKLGEILVQSGKEQEATRIFKEGLEIMQRIINSQQNNQIGGKCLYHWR